ncbi:MAG: exo-alpha-sialidase [Bryobacteraceae bacterium]|nr:exo-alpha-sialidase [Bryobacteraceae bacterium]
MKRRDFLGTLGAAAVAPADPKPEPRLVSVRKIWDGGPHNAFTDLVRFQSRWYCCFREAEDHVGGDGKLRVLVSTDGDAWKSAALVAETGVDLRDPKFSNTPDGRLMMLAGGSVYEGKTFKGRQPRVAFSSDGAEWSRPQRILAEGDWLWRATWHGGRAYGVSYLGWGTEPRNGHLYSSEDGLQWRHEVHWDVPGVSEVTLRVMHDGEMIALARRELDTRNGWIGVSKPPYKQWTWRDAGHRLGGPNFIRLPNGDLWAGSRSHLKSAPETVLARMTRDSYQPALSLPSGGDNSYPGLFWHDNLLWISYYSSHEGKTSIYLAKVKLG